MARIVLVRHGHVEGIDPERFRGRRDVDLSALGLRQARNTARRIAGQWRLAALYTSPLRRCLQTAGQITAACGTSATVLDDLNDLDYGDWEWRTHEEVRARWPALFEGWLRTPHLARFPNGESLQDLAARASNVLRFMRERHEGDTVVVVGHNANNRVLLLQALDQPLSEYWRLDQDPCCISEIEIVGQHMTVTRLNETCPLE
jgi:phosphoserine phosphatase